MKTISQKMNRMPLFSLPGKVLIGCLLLGFVCTAARAQHTRNVVDSMDKVVSWIARINFYVKEASYYKANLLDSSLRCGDSMTAALKSAWMQLLTEESERLNAILHNKDSIIIRRQLLEWKYQAEETSLTALLLHWEALLGIARQVSDWRLGRLLPGEKFNHAQQVTDAESHFMLFQELLNNVLDYHRRHESNIQTGQ